MPSILSIALNPTIDVSCRAQQIKPTKKIRTLGQTLYPGGGGVNVARVVHILGGEPELLFLSGGQTGLVLEGLINELPIEKHMVRIAGDIRLALMVHESASNFEYRFVPEGPVVSPREFEQVLGLVRKFRGDLIVASGSLPRGISDDSYSQIAQIAADNGVRFILDTSGPALRHALTNSKLFVVKPSFGELEELVGSALDEEGAIAAAMDLVKQGVAENVAVSMGAEGAFLARAQGVIRMRSVHVVTRSAVGAGDSFVGGMAYSLMQEMPMEEAFCYGLAAGAAAVMSPGTGLCQREDVIKLHAAISANLDSS